MTSPTQADHVLTVQGLTKLARGCVAVCMFTAERAGEVAALLNAGDALADELARRNKEDPRTRLHNVCEAIAEQADGSAFSREEWQRIDADNARLRTANAALAEALKGLVSVIEAARLQNLVRGVELGPAVWYVKASDAMDCARAALASLEG